MLSIDTISVETIDELEIKKGMAKQLFHSLLSLGTMEKMFPVKVAVVIFALAKSDSLVLQAKVVYK